MKVITFVAGFLSIMATSSFAQPAPEFDVAAAARFANLALDCIHKEYPNKIAHVLNGDQDVKAPRDLTPAFYGCYDWHSSVHGTGCSSGSRARFRKPHSRRGSSMRWGRA